MSDAADNQTAMHILAGIAGILSEYKPAGVDSSDTGVDSSDAGVNSSDAGVNSSDAGLDSSKTDNREKLRVQQQNNMNNCEHTYIITQCKYQRQRYWCEFSRSLTYFIIVCMTAKEQRREITPVQCFFYFWCWFGIFICFYG